MLLPLILFLLGSPSQAAPAEDERPPACITNDFIFFPTASAHLGKDWRARLELWARDMLWSKYPSRIDITGHTDSVGTRRANLRLSRRRAWAVANYLASKGVPRSWLHVRGIGMAKPLVDVSWGKPEAQNRNVYIFEQLAPEESARRDRIWARIGRPTVLC